MKQGLPLFPATRPIAFHAIMLDLRDMTPYGFPALDLPGIIRASAPHVVSAIPLEPPPRILPVYPTPFPPIGQGLRGIDLEEIQLRVVFFMT